MYGQVLTITLNRPDALNSIRPGMLDGIRQLIVNTENDDNISVIVIEGSGRLLSGVDLKVLQGIDPKQENW